MLRIFFTPVLRTFASKISIFSDGMNIGRRRGKKLIGCRGGKGTEYPQTRSAIGWKRARILFPLIAISSMIEFHNYYSQSFYSRDRLLSAKGIRYSIVDEYGYNTRVSCNSCCPYLNIYM